MAPDEFEGVPVSRLIDTRHELTALIKQNLYGRGSKSEGQAALIARNRLDDFVFRMTDDMLVKGKSADLAPLKRAIILETFGELLEISGRLLSPLWSGWKSNKARNVNYPLRSKRVRSVQCRPADRD